ncbi:MAG: site-specific DNA-methyltransferase, partial [Lachnospiraceae bacterium]|nr:site-specific DNA-methyltransferase [Lachnospiraceae bacterium]
YQFTWPDKRKAIMIANQPTEKTLRLDKMKSVGKDGTVGSIDTENIYVEGDNLDALKILRETYLGKIKMIFIDPPYNTGSDAFVYDDDYALTESDFSKVSGQRDSEGNIIFDMKINNESNGRFHTDWLNMMYPRLRIARDFLCDDGAIFITIDHVEHAALKLLCDDIFGSQCFIGDLVWRSSDNSNNNALTFSEDHNNILVYAKRPDWKPNFLNDPKKRMHFKNPDNDPKGPWFDGNPVNNPGLRVNLQYDITTPSGKIIHHPANGWRWSWETVQEKLKTGELRFSDDESRLIRRTYLCDMEGLPPSTLCVDLEVTGHTRGAKYELKKLFPEIPVTSLFSTPKPTLLIKYLLSIGSKKDSTIMDFFSGSGSTADAVMQANCEDGGNRKYILVQVQEALEIDKAGNKPPYPDICSMGEERIRRAGKEIIHKVGINAQNIDIGFRTFKVDSSNMEDVYYNPEELSRDLLGRTVDNIKIDRTPEDLLFQVMLDLGVDLSSTIEDHVIGGKKVFIVKPAGIDTAYLVACFDKGVTNETVTEIAKMEPYYAVFRDSGMESDSVAVNIDQIFETYSSQTVRKVL